MTEKSGLKIVVSFKKDNTAGNVPEICATVKLIRADTFWLGDLMKNAVGMSQSSIGKCFPTSAEAEQWASVVVEKIRVEYAATKARFDAVETPDDYEVYE